ncbi:MAG: diiron oxygenase, partial [Burkholderiales bacterium]
MAHAELSLLEQLTTNSSPYADPLTRLEWDKLDQNKPWLPATAVSLFGLPEYDALPEAVRTRLSQYEFTGFIQAGIWLEAIFIERLSKNLKHTQSAQELAYFLHEIREESGHSLMFLKL